MKNDHFWCFWDPPFLVFVDPPTESIFCVFSEPLVFCVCFCIYVFRVCFCVYFCICILDHFFESRGDPLFRSKFLCLFTFFKSGYTATKVNFGSYRWGVSNRGVCPIWGCTPTWGVGLHSVRDLDGVRFWGIENMSIKPHDPNHSFLHVYPSDKKSQRNEKYLERNRGSPLT